ncbi:MAG: hypothetical protein LC808_25010 [Actinobacteria bacterium]|nr:hypothetical protein [Actinomycetota bacterium]
MTVAMVELAESVSEGLLAMAVGAGLQVMQVMMADSSCVWLGRRSQPGLARPNRRPDCVVVQGVRDVEQKRPDLLSVGVPERKVIARNLERSAGVGDDFDHRHATHPRSELRTLIMEHRRSDGVSALGHLVKSP